eukprot:957583_1
MVCSLGFIGCWWLLVHIMMSSIHSSHQKTTYYSTLCHKRTRQTMVSLTVMCVSVAVAWVLSIATIIHHIFLHNLALHSHYIVGLFASPIPVDVVICDHINPLS